MQTHQFTRTLKDWYRARELSALDAKCKASLELLPSFGLSDVDYKDLQENWAYVLSYVRHVRNRWKMPGYYHSEYQGWKHDVVVPQLVMGEAKRTITILERSGNQKGLVVWKTLWKSYLSKK